MSTTLLRKAVGIFFLYDGIRALVSPAGYTRAWETGILTLDDILEYFAERPALTRKVAAGEIAAGLWLMLR